MRDILLLNERDIRHPQAGGAEVNLFQVGRRLAERGYRLTLFCTRFAGASAEEEIDGIRVVRFGNRLTYYLRLPRRVRSALPPGAAIIEHLCKLPFCTPLYTRAPVLAVTHHLFGRTAFWQAPFPVAAVVYSAEWLIPPVYRRCTFLAVSPSTRADLIHRGVDASRIRVVPNGVDCSHYAPLEAAPAAPPTVLALGRVEPYKRLDVVLRAFAQVRSRLPEARLLIVGSGTGLEAVREDIRRLNLTGCVSAPGLVSEEEKLRLIHSAHVAVSTSEKEGWGLTVLEAAACGLPTVASDVPGLRDAVVAGETGLLVPYDDAPATAEALTALLGDEARRQRLGRAARRWAERFSWDAVAEATAQSIEEAVTGTVADSPLQWFDDVGQRVERREVGC